MSIQSICIFLGVLVLSSVLFIVADKYLWTELPWVIIVAILGGFLAFLAIKKTDYNVTAISVLVAFLTVSSTWMWNWYQERESRKLHHQHVTPGISCYVEYPLKTEDGKTFRDKKNPDIVVRNDGPIKAVSVACDVVLYIYDEEKSEVVQIISSSHGGFNHLISAKELCPFSQDRQSWIGIDGDRMIGVYHIKVIYHRESDMEEFSREQYILIKQHEIVPQEKLKKDHAYQELIKKIISFDASRIRSRLTITAASEHTWFAETDGSVAAMIDPSGKLISQTPELQSETPRAGYPFLEISPRRWKATSCYIDANIIEGYLEVKMLVRAANIGDSGAMLTENGFDIIESVAPGAFAWTTKTVRIGIKKDSPITLSDYLKEIDAGKEKLNLSFFIYYRPANKSDELLKVIFSYRIGKNDVTRIAPDLDD